MCCSEELDTKDAAPVTEDSSAMSKRPGFSGESTVCLSVLWLAHTRTRGLQTQAGVSSCVRRVPGVQAVPHRPGQHAARAGPGPVQQEVRGGLGHQVPRPSALQEDQEQPGLGHHPGPPARHPLQEALHLRLAEPGEDPGGGRQDQLHHHQVTWRRVSSEHVRAQQLAKV